jgi:hypothetical protein
MTTGVRKLFAAVFVANLSIAFFLIWQNLNFLQIDLAGHIASSAQFARDQLHGFSDRMFLGYTHSLFYPPLEDFLISLTHWMVRADFFDSYRLYLAILIGLYYFTIWRVGRSLRNIYAFGFFCVAVLFLLNIEKPELLDLQGMSLVDLFITGLSNQFLAGIGLFVVCKQLIDPTPNQRRILVFACSFAILSHIVVGVTCFMLVGFHYLKNESKRNALFDLLTILGLCSFYVVPFLLNKNLLVSSNIFRFQPWPAFVISVLAVVFYRKDKTTNVFLITSTLLLSTVTVISKIEFLNELFPRFHYYRFTIIAFYLLIVGIAAGISREPVNNSGQLLRKRIGLGLGVGLLVYFFSSFNLQKVNTHWPSLQRTHLDYSQVGDLNTPTYGRYLVFGKDRSSDTGVDSLLSVHHPEFRSSKGLFWESSYTNTMQSSFLATLLSPPVVLDFFYYYGYSCPVQKCLMDQYFRIFNVNGFIGNIDYLNFIEPPQKECFQKTIQEGTNYFSFHQTGSFRVNSESYPIYRLEHKSGVTPPASYSNEAVEILNPATIKILQTNRNYFHREVMEKVYQDCNRDFTQSSMPAYLLPGEAAKFEELRKKFPTPNRSHEQQAGVVLNKVTDHEFTFQLPKEPTWFLLKLAPQPGMRILNEQGESISLLKGMPHTFGVGSGTMKVVFDRSWSFWLGYFITLSTIMFWVWRRLRGQKSASG